MLLRLQFDERWKVRRMLFEILGPLRIQGDVWASSPVRRAILTAFLLRPGQVVTVGELAELLWDDPPISVAANIRSHVTALRRDLDGVDAGLGRKVRTFRGGQSGYGLDVTSDECDLAAFTLVAQRGRSLLRSGEINSAVDTLEAAVALWRGSFGLELPLTRWFSAHARGLNSARFDACEDLFIARILSNRTEMLSYRIECLIAEEPYRQNLWELLAGVYCISGDAVGALDTVKRCQVLFTEDLGLDLPPNVEAMRRAALKWDREEAFRLIAARATTAEPLSR